MKKLFLFILSLFVFGFYSFAQNSSNVACVGYIYVDVDLTCDKTEQGMAVYPVPTPNGEDYGLFEDSNSQTLIPCMGPGVPYITQFTEDQPMLHVNLHDIKRMYELGNDFAYIDAPIKASVPNLGNPYSEQVQCYYTIILVIKDEWGH